MPAYPIRPFPPRRSIVRLVAFVSVLTLVTSAHAVALKQIFDDINAFGNAAGPSILQTQSQNIVTGGSLFMRTPRRTYQLASFTPPSIGAGCGGIDLYTGGFSFINRDAFVAMLRNIGNNAIGYSFKLAIQNLCPVCDNVMQALQATSQFANNLNINSCEMAQGLVQAVAPDEWTKRSAGNKAKTWGTMTNRFNDFTDAWKKVYSSDTEMRDTLNAATTAAPELKQLDPRGNVTWRALKRIGSLTDSERGQLIALFGSVIIPDNPQDAPRHVPPLPIDLPTLIGAPGATNQLLPTYRCTDGTGEFECLSPVADTGAERTLLSLVQDKMRLVMNAVSSRSAYSAAELTEIVQFLNVTDIPVYKMIAVATIANNTALAERMLAQYQELIAAEYAQAWIRQAAEDIRTALDLQTASADNSQTALMAGIRESIKDVESRARQEIERARASTRSAYTLVQEIQFYERTLAASLPKNIRQSLAFQKGLGG